MFLRLDLEGPLLPVEPVAQEDAAQGTEFSPPISSQGLIYF